MMKYPAATFDEITKAQKSMFSMLCKAFAVAIQESDDPHGLAANYNRYVNNFKHRPSFLSAKKAIGTKPEDKNEHE